MIFFFFSKEVDIIHTQGLDTERQLLEAGAECTYTPAGVPQTVNCKLLSVRESGGPG